MVLSGVAPCDLIIFYYCENVVEEPSTIAFRFDCALFDWCCIFIKKGPSVLNKNSDFVRLFSVCCLKFYRFTRH